jgi:hypothetical protein
VAIGDHVDALHGRDRLDIFQAYVRGVLVQLQGTVQKAVTFGGLIASRGCPAIHIFTCNAEQKTWMAGLRRP